MNCVRPAHKKDAVKHPYKMPETGSHFAYLGIQKNSKRRRPKYDAAAFCV